MIHEMKIQDVYFDKLKSNIKLYEIRLNDDKRKQISVGDTIIFKKNSNLNDILQARVEGLIHFSSFMEMISTLPPKEVGFEVESFSQIVDIYHTFYNECDENKFGVLAIKVKILE